jgi:hypothetical protein
MGTWTQTWDGTRQSLQRLECHEVISNLLRAEMSTWDTETLRRYVHADLPENAMKRKRAACDASYNIAWDIITDRYKAEEG